MAKAPIPCGQELDNSRMCVYMHVDVKGQPCMSILTGLPTLILLFSFVYCFSFKTDLSLAWNFPNSQVWLASKPQGSAYHMTPSAWITTVHYHALLLFGGPRDETLTLILLEETLYPQF